MIGALWLLIKGINPRVYLGIGLCIATLYSFHAFKNRYIEEGKSLIYQEWKKADAEQAEAKLTLDREMRRAVDAITVNSQKEKDHAKTTIDSLRADLRTGSIRLSVATAAASAAADTGIRGQEARADILPASADRIISIIGEADDTVRDLNECIDKYNEVRGVP